MSGFVRSVRWGNEPFHLAEGATTPGHVIHLDRVATGKLSGTAQRDRGSRLIFLSTEGIVRAGGLASRFCETTGDTSLTYPYVPSRPIGKR